ncbi:MAG: DNA-binding protein [Desulfovibrionaceae bacterium]
MSEAAVQEPAGLEPGGPVLCYKGAKAICEAIGENPRELARLVRQSRLPAWRRHERGAWRALPEDLLHWLRRQRDAYLEGGGPQG